MSAYPKVIRSITIILKAKNYRILKIIGLWSLNKISESILLKTFSKSILKLGISFFLIPGPFIVIPCQQLMHYVYALIFA